MPRGLTLAALALALALPAASPAQLSRERIKVTDVRLGLPGTGGVKGFKAGQWAPVYVDLECSRDTEEDFQVIVSTTDADEAVTEGSVELPAMNKGDVLRGNELGRLPYLKPGLTYSGASVKVRVKGAKSGRVIGEAQERSFTGVDIGTYLIVGVGTNLNGMQFPAGGGLRDEAVSGLRNGWVQAGQILDVGYLPDQWIGYGAVDLLVLGTGPDKAFWEALAAPQHAKRRQALAEWVRRGGRAVVCVGANPDVLGALKEIDQMLPAAVPPGGKRMTKTLVVNWTVNAVTTGKEEPFGYSPDRPGEFPVNTLQPRADRPTKVILSEDKAGTKPLAVQAPYGQGRVTVIAFDPDRPPAADWGKRHQFWENLVNQAGYLMPAATNKREDRWSRSQTDDAYSAQLQGSLDFFEGVPVVSFGWVALFILIYIVLIGPVDYFFLKKVVRRLEWTWVTFPIMVVTVSAGAYFAAYALKGKDLKINKVDVVDVDLAGRRVDGNTWFTLFSPRIQNYTIGLEPAGPADGQPGPWTPADPSDAARNTVLSWQGLVTNSYGRGGGGGLLMSKTYQYQSTIDPTDPNRDLYASGLEKVPIQVWTSKAFHAQWAAPLDPATPPVSADLRLGRSENRNEDILLGTLTNNLPVGQFTDAALVFKGKVFDLDAVWPTGVERPISHSTSGGKDLGEWLRNKGAAAVMVPNVNSPGGPTAGTPSNPKFPLWGILFADAVAEAQRQNVPNASLRKLDQSWRVGPDHSEQAMLVLRIPTQDGVKEGRSAEDMTRDPVSPSRLWLGDLPTGGGRRPAVAGTLKQETYVRVFIPVKPAPKK